MSQRTPRNPYNYYDNDDYNVDLEDRLSEEYIPEERRTSSASRSPGSSSQRRGNSSSSSARRSSSGAASYRKSSGRSSYDSRSRSSSTARRSGAAASSRRKKKGKGGVVALLVVLVLLIGGAVFALSSGILKKPEEVVVDTRPLPADPAVVRSATVASTGDIVLHVPILEACATGDGYDFSFCFSNVAPVYKQSDLMLANLEVTLGGPESGEYTGYPGFNSPDAIVPALRDAGVDACLTANNHSYDTGDYGMMRTLDVLDEYALGHLGSRKSTDEPFLMTKSINDIRLGMLCYTYDTREYTEGSISLNFNYLSDESAAKIKTFNYEYLDEFYADVQQQLDYMDMLNVDAKVIFMHWGTEYEDYPNDYQQTQIAQRLCDMGVDVIIGGHPHVIQEFDILSSDNGHQTICLYSMGNELSNQRKDLMLDEDGGRGYTEDGLVFQVTFEKLNNGKTRIGAVDITPTWVELDGYGYQIIALNGEVDPWSWGASDTYAAIDSYNRTIERLGEDYITYRTAKHQSDIVEYIEY